MSGVVGSLPHDLPHLRVAPGRTKSRQPGEGWRLCALCLILRGVTHEPPAPALVPFGEPAPVLVQIGDITCTATTVHTPSGPAPIDTVFWNVTDQSREESYTPAWAIIVGVLLLVVCLLGLIFLFTKNTRYVGWVQVSVQGPGLVHTTNLPAGYGVAQDAMGRVAYARSLTQFAKNQKAIGS